MQREEMTTQLDIANAGLYGYIVDP